MKSETSGKDLPASPACGYISKTGENSVHVKENCLPGVTGLWLSAWYAGSLGSAQRTQSGVEGLQGLLCQFVQE